MPVFHLLLENTETPKNTKNYVLSNTSKTEKTFSETGWAPNRRSWVLIKNFSNFLCSHFSLRLKNLAHVVVVAFVVQLSREHLNHSTHTGNYLFFTLSDTPHSSEGITYGGADDFPRRLNLILLGYFPPSPVAHVHTNKYTLWTGAIRIRRWANFSLLSNGCQHEV